MGRIAKFQEEMAKSIPVAPTAPGPTQQVKIPELVSEVDRLRLRIAEMEMEWEEARNQYLLQTSFEGPIWRRKSGEFCTASTQDSTEGRSWRLSSAEEHFSSEFQPVQPIGLRELASVHSCPASRVVAWGARRARVCEARNPGPDDVLEPTQLESGAHSSEESRTSGLTVRQESDTKSVASVNRDNGELQKRTPFWRTNCGGTPEYKSTRARRRSGTRVDLLQLVGTYDGPQRNRVERQWGHPKHEVRPGSALQVVRPP